MSRVVSFLHSHLLLIVGWSMFLPERGLAATAGPLISEVVTANATGLRDDDGDEPDWIELFNPGQAGFGLAGWFLTDDPDDLQKWTFPAVSLPAQGFLVVFASGKNRVDPKSDLHTNFRLDRDGEFLALVQPDGRTVATRFDPTLPALVGDLSYGSAMSTEDLTLIGPSSPGRSLVPVDGGLGRGWIQPEFDDGPWRTVTGAIGYDRPEGTGPEPIEPAPTAPDVTRPGDYIIPTSSNSPGNETVINAIDDNPATKYLNFDKIGAGLTVTPASGPTIVTGLTFTSANDAPERDPTSFLLRGSNDGQTFVDVARGPIPNFPGRFVTVGVTITNATAWKHYHLTFPTVRNAGAAVAVQIAEIELLGWVGGPPAPLADLIREDLGASLFRQASGVYLRLPFVMTDAPKDGQLVLGLRYDDGFVAYLNGVEVARANAPANPAHSSTATTNRLRRDAIVESRINLSDRVSLLRPGTNVLALHGLNSSADSREFLLQARLNLARIVLQPPAYLARPTPGAANAEALDGLVGPIDFDPPRGFFDRPIAVRLACPTPETVIRYTTNGTPPSPTNGLVYRQPVVIDRTTPLRAAAFREGWYPSPHATHTYLFVDDIVTQTRASTLAAGFPTAWSGQTADYGLDARVVGPNGTDRYGGKYTRALKTDLRSLPTLSIVMSLDDLFGAQGIYSHPESRGDAWERPASLEWINADGTAGFQANAGLRIQGGAFRRFDLTRKKSFRVVLREEYGAPELEYPVFGPDATDRFDNFILRANSNDAWPYGGGRAVYVRDTFAMETARELGIASSHGHFVHLYLNGVYWGLYNPVERPDAAFSAAYLGGDQDSWDSINQDSAPDGTYDAWNRMIGLAAQGLASTANYQRIQGNHPDGTRNPAYEDLIDVENYIDYLILNFYLGNVDWPGRNWWAGRNRDGSEGFQFRPWDSETALDFSGVDANILGAGDAVARPYAALKANADFRQLFGDHVHRHFFHGGPLYVNPASPRWDPVHPENNRPAARFAALAEAARPGIIGESARWGDQSGSLFTRDEHWQKAVDELLANYFPRRSTNVLRQFRQAGLYPSIDAPTLSQRGGTVGPGFRLGLSAPAGTIYYTTNGADPRKAFGTPNVFRYAAPFPLGTLTTVRTRALQGTNWSALEQATFVGTLELVVGELHYHPADPSPAEETAGFGDADDFEFIELHNAGALEADLTGVRLAEAVQFDFTGSPITRLAPGANVLVVRNRAAFEARYGPGRPVAGEYSGRFSNAGERVVVLDALGRVLVDWTYGTSAPWPESADGEGPSLELVDPFDPPGSPASWRPSTHSGGTPGESSPPPALALTVEHPFPGYLRLSFRVQAGLGYTLQARDALTRGDWSVVRNGETQVRTGTTELLLPIGTGERARFFRVSIP